MQTICKGLVLNGLVLACTALATLSAHAHSGHGHDAAAAQGSAHAAGHGAGHDAGHDHADHGGHGDHAAPSFPDPATAAAPQGIEVGNCWVRALPNRLPAAGYFRIENSGGHDAVLIGAQAEGFGRVMLHTHTTTGGMSAMVHVDKVTVPAGGSFDFAPGGHHLMLEKPTIDLKVGTQHTVVLWFEENRALSVQCDVRPPGAMQ